MADRSAAGRRQSALQHGFLEQSGHKVERNYNFGAQVSSQTPPEETRRRMEDLERLGNAVRNQYFGNSIVPHQLPHQRDRENEDVLDEGDDEAVARDGLKGGEVFTALELTASTVRQNSASPICDSKIQGTGTEQR
ncbi:hypothetical protein N7490_004741 [Penicillium lividum]|nr:hypothetical protein N7490_004741 [Penicillium lividum]